jgi:TonB-dependent starch-binding outer membrane protein SusC
MPGDPRYTDVNDDGRIDYDNDFMVIGNALPDFIFGINNQLNYKNWDVTFLIQGTYGNDLFNIARSRREERAGRSTNKLNRWTPDNQNTDVPAVLSAQYRYEYREAYNAANPDNPLVSTIIFPAAGSNVTGRWIEDASYLRLKNVTIAYNIPTRYLVNNLRVYASGTNLLTFTKYSGFDPEVSSFTGSDGQLGTDYNNYPPSRFINLGVNVTF